MPWNKEQEREYARELKPYETSLTDMEWKVIKPSLPKPSGGVVRLRRTCV